MELRISSDLEKRFLELRILAFQARDLVITKKKAELLHILEENKQGIIYLMKTHTTS